MGEIVGLGEILWDLLPDGPQLGGAPFNFTFHAHQLGHAAAMISRIGDDTLGQEIRDRLAALGLADASVQRDREHPTGTVDVTLDAQGVPSYTINTEVAYDYLAWDEQVAERCRRAKALCFGTLIQRHAVARATVQKALAEARQAIIVYDVNIRQRFYTKEWIENSMRASRWIKLNQDELVLLREMFGLAAGTVSAAVADLRRRYDLELACVTRGGHGCLVQTANEEIDIPGIPMTVVDTIGAGDAFTAGLVVWTLEGKTLGETVNYANRYAARVVAAAGGTPTVRRDEI